MNQPWPRHRTALARQLRKQPTDAERRLWQRLRRNQLGVRFHRQRPLGRYIVDFYCPAARLVIEIDGSQHFDTKGRQQDQVRDAALAQRGLRVLRFDNREVLQQTTAVVESIHSVVQTRIGGKA